MKEKNEKEILLFRLNLSKDYLQENQEVSLENTITILKSAENNNSCFVLMKKTDGYVIELIENISSVPFLKDSSRIDIRFHIWTSRDPQDEEPSKAFYDNDKEQLFSKIIEYWDNDKKVYCIICDPENNPIYIGKLIAYSKNAKNLLEKIFTPPDMGNFTTAFFLSANNFFKLREIAEMETPNQNLENPNLESILGTVKQIRELCSTKECLMYPLKYEELGDSESKKLENLINFLKCFESLKKHSDKLEKKKNIIKNFLKGKFLESITYLVFEELLNYKIQFTGYESWADTLREDVIKEQAEQGEITNKVRKIPDFYFSYRSNSIPPIYYKNEYIKTGWLEIKYRSNITPSDINNWKSSYDSEIFLLIYNAARKQFYFLRVEDLNSIENSLNELEEFAFKNSLLPLYNKKITEIMNEMIDVFQKNN